MLKINILVDTETTYTFIEEDNMIEGLALKKQMDDSIENLQGNIECAEVNCTLNNLFNEFNITSPTSPYSSLKNGLQVKILSVEGEVERQVFEGYLVDFVAPTSKETQTCNIRVVDRLQKLLNEKIELNDNIQIERDMGF